MDKRGLDKISLELSAACNLSAWMSNKLNEVIINDTLRNRVAVSCFAVTLDHFDAVLALLQRTPKLYSSAFALMRPVFESYIRGMWLMHCATDEQIEDFSKGTFQLPRKIEVMIDSIERACNFDGKQLSVSHSSAWEHLCDYTHTGSLQVQRWNKHNSIEPNYSNEEILEAIHFASAYALLASVGILNTVVNCNHELVEDFFAKAKEIAI